MKKILVIASLLLTFVNLSAKNTKEVILADGKKITANKILNNNSLGTEFIIAVPPNERPNYGETDADYISLFITSPYKTKVTFQRGSRTPEPYYITANEITEIRLDTTYEVRTYESAQSERTIKLTADRPFSVSLLSHKDYTSDGMMAIPTASWGKKYMHLCLYDNNESHDLPWSKDSSEYTKYGGGFIVLAKENATTVTIIYRDQKFGTSGVGRTRYLQKRGGDTVRVVLNKGQYYAVLTDGLTNTFDISGSTIDADKPVGVISYIERTDVPNTPYEYGYGRNCLFEMIPPISSWGKNIATVEFNRESGCGDFMRVIASEDNTTINVNWYNKTKKTLLGSVQKTLDAGDIWEYNNSFDTTGKLQFYGVRGAISITASAPIMAMQYSYSYNWDNSPKFDPFMIVLTPTDQYVPLAVFQSQKYFKSNFFNFIAYGYVAGDDTLPKFKGKSASTINKLKLLSITVNGDPIDNSILSQGIPGTNLYWQSVQLDKGAYVVKSDSEYTTFGGYVYGCDVADGYGYPAAISFRKDGEVDIEKPKIVSKSESDCGTFSYIITDSTNYSINDSIDQVDLGISQIKFVQDSGQTYNYKLINSDGDSVSIITFDWALSAYNFKLAVIDKSIPARVVVAISDLALNMRLDTVIYNPEILASNLDSVDFGTKCIDGKYTLDSLKIYNHSGGTVTITSVKFYKNSTPFSASFDANGATLLDGDSLSVKLIYDLQSFSATADRTYYDTLIVNTICSSFKIMVKGSTIERSYAPSVTNLDFGSRRLKSTNIGYVTLSNLSPTPLVIIHARLRNSNVNFKCLSCDSSSLFSKTASESGAQKDSINIYFEYKPFEETTTYDTLELMLYDQTSGKSYPDLLLAAIQGSGYLPKAEISKKYIFAQPLKVGETALDTAVVEIKSTSSSADLLVKSINTNYKYGYRDINYIDSVACPFVLPMGDSIKIRYTFTADNHGDRYLSVYDRQSIADVELDTKEATLWQKYYLNENIWENSNPRDSINILSDTLLATVFDIIDSAVASPTVFAGGDSILACDSIVGSFTVNNYSEIVGDTSVKYSTDLIISGITESGDTNILYLKDFSLPDTITANTSQVYQVVFNPVQGESKTYSAEYLLINNWKDFILKTNVQATSVIGEATFALGSDTLTHAPGDTVKINVSLKSDSAQNNGSKIRNVEFGIQYDLRKLEYINILNSYQKGGWAWSAKETIINDTLAETLIKGSGIEDLPFDCEIAAINYRTLLLSSGREIDPRIVNATFADRSNCLKAILDTTVIKINACVIDLRGILIGGAYALAGINPNPISNENFTIKYSIAYEELTSIELYNSLGEKVRTILNEVVNGGDRSIEVNTKGLSSGVYYIRMRAGVFSKTQTVVIE